MTDPDVARALDGWVARTAPAVRAAILGTKLVQLTLPGVADVYQGTESQVIALVDPDNRGPVDAAGLAERLRRMDAGAGRHRPGLADEKLAVTAAALRLRRDDPRRLRRRARRVPADGHLHRPRRRVRPDRGPPASGDHPRQPADGLAYPIGWLARAHRRPARGPVAQRPGRRRAVPMDGGPRALAPMLRTRPVALLARIDRHAGGVR